MYKIKSIIFVIIFLIPAGVLAQEAFILNLEQCRDMALENSEVMKIADENFGKAQGERMAAHSAWFPNVSASATGMYKNIGIQEELYLPTQVFDATTGQLVPNIVVDPGTGQPITGSDGNPIFNTYGYLPIDITLYGGMMAGVSAQQPLYAGGKIRAGNKMAQIGESMADTNKGLQEANLIYATDQAYYIYLSTKAKVRLARGYQELLAEVLSMVRNSHEAGMTNRNELLKVQVQYNDASLHVQKAETGLVLTRMSLCRIIGVDLHSSLEITDSIPDFQYNAGHLGLATAADRLEYQLMKKQVEIAEQNINLVRGDYLPTAGISFGYNYSIIGLEGMNNQSDHGVSAMASINIPITTFGERKGKLQSARADQQIRQLEMEQANQYLQLEMEQARLNYNDAWTRVEMTETAVEQAAENMRVSDDNYSLGMETIVNLLEAKAEWAKANSSRIDALTSFKIQESNLLRVSNRLK